VIQELFDACHAAVPDTLVVDDSSWIGWQRVTDFWDEHPYGNNRWWPGAWAEFAQPPGEGGTEPLLLGECIAADTWTNRDEWERGARRRAADGGAVVGAGAARRPASLRRLARARVRARRGRDARSHFARPRAAHAQVPDRAAARDAPRRRLRRLGRARLPTARMGLRDDFDRWKWSAADFAFQRDVALSLLTEGMRGRSAGSCGRGRRRRLRRVGRRSARKLSLELRGLDGPIGALERDVTPRARRRCAAVVYEATLPATATAQRLVLTPG